MNVIDEIQQITEVAAFGIEPIHEQRDARKVDDLMVSMVDNGWCGAPIVVDGEMAMTGSHRLAAVNNLWNHEGILVEIPRVEIRDVCALYGVDWDALLERQRDEYAVDWYRAVVGLPSELPVDVVAYLGLDVH